MEKEDLNRILENLYFQYQPIVNIKSGEIYGYEALIRGFDTLGFKNPHQLFDYAYKNGFIFHLDIKLREKAIYEFSENFKMGQRLFFNLDSRIILSKDHKNGETLKILENLKIPSKMMVFEVSERFSLSEELIQRVFLYYKEQGFEIALDDFGVGSVCLEAIYKLSPDYLKIDGFFIEDFNKDFIKKEIVYSLSELCRKLNIKVIAEKIETKEDIYMLEEVEISLGQGYYIKKPSQLDKQEKLQLNVQLKRSKSEDVSYIKKYIKESITLYMDDSATTLMEILNKNGKDLKPIIILDKKGHPLSVISFKKMASILNNSIYMNLYFSRKDKLVSDLK
ncbi:EAL domain-containing protein, partial [Sulfurihydrogenibium sp.]|uniref:EAL domain-containing protein n=1 Tax=Sulfurihydrogenibium sp. TaxID=2053621 RepID=UPI002607329E